MITTLPRLKVPLFGELYKSVDEVELSDKTAELIDAYTDSEGYSIRRPGLGLFHDVNIGAHPINGLFPWAQKNAVIVVCDGRQFKLEYTLNTPILTELTGVSLGANLPVSMATNGTYCFMANGGRIAFTNGTVNSSFIADSDAPTLVDCLGVMDNYLIANRVGTNQIYFSEAGDPLTWNALNFFSAAGNSDIVLSFRILNREIYLFGSNSIEIWENNGTTPFERIPGGFIETGCGAKNSPVVTSKEIYWLNQDREFMKFDGKTPITISSPYSREIERFSQVDDCYGFRAKLKGESFIVWNFPSEDRCLVYRYSGVAENRWAEWKAWIPETALYRRWLGDVHCWVPFWSKHLVGSRASSVIYDMSHDYDTDNGADIRMYRRTGHIDYGTKAHKLNTALSVRLKRGSGNFSRTPQLMLRWKDDNKSWSKEHWISLGDEGDYEILKTIRRTGRYRTRQYEISATDAVPIVFGDAEEDVEILTR